MDNFTHSLAGWALGQAGLKTKTRKGLAALILGANLPDIDVFFGWVPWAPLAMHRGFTHGLVGGVIVMPPLLFGLLWLLDRWQVRRGTVFPSGLALHHGWLLALCYIGTLTHPLLDLQTSYAVQLLSPFSTTWFHTETLFIIDVWIWTALSLAIWQSRRRERNGGEWRKPAMAGLAALCAYIALNGAISLLARNALLTELTPVTPDVVIAGEEPVIFWRRSLVWREHGEIGRAVYDPLRNPARIINRAALVPDMMADPLVRRAIALNSGIDEFLRWSIIPIAQIDYQGCEATVSIGDARFGAPVSRGRLSRTVTLPLEGPGCSASPSAP